LKITYLIMKNINMKIIKNILKKTNNFYYKIKYSFQAGIILKGWELKSLKQNKLQIVNSNISVNSHECWWHNVTVPPLHCVSDSQSMQSIRTKKLLLKKKHILQLKKIIYNKKLNLIPLKIYWNNNKIKLSIGIGEKKIIKSKEILNKNTHK